MTLDTRFVLASALVGLCACGGATTPPSPEASTPRAIVRGGDGRTGGYETVTGWWKPAPDHEGPWTATGNLVDAWRRGAVIDFIDLRFWPVFNIGDVAIVVGVTVALGSAFRGA